MSTYSQTMLQLSDAELLRIVHEERSYYEPDAVEFAERELERRNLGGERVEQIKKELDTSRRLREKKQNLPLGAGWKLGSLLLPGIFAMFNASLFKADGYDRKATELTRWTFYGYGFWLGGIVLFGLLAKLVGCVGN